MNINNKHGFTLIELILTIGMLAVVLAAMTSFIGPTLKQLYRVEGRLDSSIVGDAVCDQLRENLTYALDICIYENDVPLSVSLLDPGLKDESSSYWDMLLKDTTHTWTGYWDDFLGNYDALLLRDIAYECPVITPEVNGIYMEYDPVYLKYFHFGQSADVSSLHISIKPLTTSTMFLTVSIKDRRERTQYEKTLFIECINAKAINLFRNGAPIMADADGSYIDVDPFEDDVIYVDILKGLKMLG